MNTATTETPIPTLPDPTTATAEAVQALLDGLQALAPTMPPSEVHRAVHRAAQALQRALDAGTSIGDILTSLVMATAPPTEPLPFQPWAPLLPMSFTEFAQAGVALHVTLPALGEAVWLASDEATQEAVVRETKLWGRYVKLPDWMLFEADRLKLPEAERTVGRFIEALGGVVIGWRPPEAR